jgi:D-alanine-D-alanine ligase
MKIVVDKDWWQNIFDSVYLLTDARSVCNRQLTCQEVDCIIQFLKPKKSAKILDLCGGHGRHSLELCRRGFKDVTVLDYSGYLIEVGKNKAREEKLNTIFIQGDARDVKLPTKSFQFVIIMASSFGYCIDESENKKILDQAFRLLRSKGTLMLDLPNRDYIIRNFKPISRHEINKDVEVIREKEIEEDIMYSRERVLSKKDGCIRDKTYCVHLYGAEKILKLMHKAGFSSTECNTNFMDRSKQGDFGHVTNRMIVLGRKH